jgi:hypothetical protein
MTASLSCESLRDDIIALLYEDGDLAEKSRARDHLAQCVPCRLEYSELKGVRRALGGWSLPVVTPLRQSNTGRSWVPPSLTAAAGLILGLGVATLGRNALSTPSDQTATHPSVPTLTAEQNATALVSDDRLQEALKAQESRLQEEIADLRRSLTQTYEASASPVSQTQSTRPDSGSKLSAATIERLLKASEERQLRLFEERLASLRTETDLQRQYDMAQIAAGLAYVDSRAGADAARTSELMKNLVRVTAKPQDR